MFNFATYHTIMLLEGFYTVLDQEVLEQTLHTRIELNAAHDIFKGHFPNNPVTPGVCMLQIFKEIISSHTQKELMISECSNVKFMAIINPEIHPVLSLTTQINPVDENAYKVKAQAVFDATTALKLSFVLKVVS